MTRDLLKNQNVQRLYTVSQKRRHYTVVHIFAKYRPIFTILSPTYSVGRLVGGSDLQSRGGPEKSQKVTRGYPIGMMCPRLGLALLRSLWQFTIRQCQLYKADYSRQTVVQSSFEIRRRHQVIW